MSDHHHRREWAHARSGAKDRDAWRCRQCYKAGVLEVHHQQQVKHGGGDDLENLLTLCRSCHLAHHQKPKTRAQSEWAQLVQELL